MKKSWVIAIIVAIILAISIIIFFSIRREKTKNRFEFPSTLVVNNYTPYEGADTLAMIILNKILMYDTMKVNIYDMRNMFSGGEIQLAGFIVKDRFEPHSYNLFVRTKDLPITIKTFLSHELSHLKQIEIGDLIQLQGDTNIIYKGDTINYFKVPYNKRLYEIDAFTNQLMIEKRVNFFLYRK